MSLRLPIGISACLLGERVRYDGGHKLQADLIAALGHDVEWVPFCPEDGAGLGTPREPMHLEQDGGRLRLYTNEIRVERTAALETYTRIQIAFLCERGITACVLKARSPSCGVRDTAIAGDDGSASLGAGLFTQMLVAAMPGLPVFDEEELCSTAARAELLRRAAAHRG